MALSWGSWDWAGSSRTLLVDVWNLSGILDLNDRNMCGWETSWDLWAGVESLFGAGLALLDYWWLVLGGSVAGTD